MNASVDLVDILVAVVEVEDAEEEVDKSKESVVSMAVIDEVTVILNMELKSQMSPVTVRENSGTYYQAKQE